MGMSDKEMSFWDHLDELRSVLIKSVSIVIIFMLGAFFCKNFLFNTIILAPTNSDFVLYRLFNTLTTSLGLGKIPDFDIDLINIEVAAQFFTHVKVSLYVAIIVAMPFILYFLWGFVAPALYKNEKRSVKVAFGFAGLLFYVGIIVGYLFVFPLTLRFLGTYQVSPDVVNTLSLKSYISMFLSLIMIMGIVFELPALALLLSKFGIINREMLVNYRKHAIVVSLVVAALITPSGDAITLLFVAIPIYFLYEISVLVTKPAKKEEEDDID